MKYNDTYCSIYVITNAEVVLTTKPMPMQGIGHWLNDKHMSRLDVKGTNKLHIAIPCIFAPVYVSDKCFKCNIVQSLFIDSGCRTFDKAVKTV